MKKVLQLQKKMLVNNILFKKSIFNRFKILLQVFF